MPLRTEDNMMDGLSVFVQSEEELSQVPLSHRSLIGTEERTALHDLATYFHRLAKKAKRIVLREWLTMLADCKDWILELHKPGMKGPRNDVLLRFYLENESSPAIRLLSGTSPTKLPRSLAEVYRLFNGTNHFGYGMAGGLWRVEDLSTFGRAGPWLSDENSLDPDTCIPFFDTMSGSMLCYQLPDRAIWYTGGDGMLKDTGSLDEMVESYFFELLKGGTIDPFS